MKDEKRPWILRAREASVHVEGKTTWDKSQKWPTTLIYISCGWESFKEVQLFHIAAALMVEIPLIYFNMEACYAVF